MYSRNLQYLLMLIVELDKHNLIELPLNQTFLQSSGPALKHPPAPHHHAHIAPPVCREHRSEFQSLASQHSSQEQYFTSQDSHMFPQNK